MRHRADRTVVFTIGYAGRTLPEFLDALSRAGVTRVIDVRELPLSRRKGFSKTPLSTALAGASIDYVHLRAAGNPYRDQRADVKTCLRLYACHVDQRPEIIDLVLESAHGHSAALLCVEEHAAECHRGVLSKRLRARRRGLVVRDL